MPKNIIQVANADPSRANPHRMWLFGQSWDFYVVTCNPNLTALGFQAELHPKSHIVLHGTAGRSPAEQTVTSWNTENAANPPSKARSAHFVVERKRVPQVARPAGGSADQQDTNIVDALRVRDFNVDPNWESAVSFHGSDRSINRTSIGIEITNASESFWIYNFNPAVAAQVQAVQADEPTFDDVHRPLANCPAPINVGTTAAPSWVCPHGRPRDWNRWIHLPAAPAGYTQQDFHAFQDEQYMTLVLLLRHLCIKHRIPRQFFGRGKEEVFHDWLFQNPAPQQRLYRQVLKHFRGILVHRNTASDGRICPGVLNRNRLYRGISDEWWMPVLPDTARWLGAVQPDASPRPYYSGPFWTPPYVAGQPARPSCFRYRGGQIRGDVYHDADLDALVETRSFFDVDKLETYYNVVETRDGGIFPVGANRVWHGGIHLPVDNNDPSVYAAAGGTIVAARLSSHEDAAENRGKPKNDQSVTDYHRKFGSQRFVLIRHAVYRELEIEPGEAQLGAQATKRINYSQRPANLAAGGIPQNPVYVFSMYMHLAPIHDKTREDDQNPPWFNAWRRANPNLDIGMDGDKGKVFAPNIQVSLGDILGASGYFRGQRMIHFEVITHRNTELQGAPWDDNRLRVEDTDQNIICDVATLDAYIRDRMGDGLDTLDVLAAAPQVRKVKALHKSEWSLTDENQIVTLVPHPDRRRVLWPHIRRFSWVSEAVAANPPLQQQLGDASGMFWHYHPITFMEHINRLVLAENRNVPEDQFHPTNVLLDDNYFLYQFVDWSAGNNSYVSAAADGTNIQIYDLAAVAPHPEDSLHFRRRDIACGLGPGVHSDGGAVAQSTHFSLALLETAEFIRQSNNHDIDITLSHVCGNHGANVASCVMNNAADLTKHQAGTAVDIRPRPPLAPNVAGARIQGLWDSVATVVDPLNLKYHRYCGMASQANYPSGFDGIEYRTFPPQLEAALRAHQNLNLSAADIANFRIHLELRPSVDNPVSADTTPVARLRVILESIYALNDQDWFGPGEWTMQASAGTGARTALIGSMKARKVNTGDTVPLNWTTDLSIAQGGSWNFAITGVDEDLIWDDPLGAVAVNFDQNSNWGIGRWAKKSTNGSFAVTVNVSSLEAEEHPADL